MFAKQLIDETRLPIAQIACAAGFASLHRFNSSFKRLFGHAPRSLRHSGHRSFTRGAISVAGITVNLHYRPPYDWPAILAFLAARAIVGIEKINGQRYTRTVMHDGEAGSVEVAHRGQSSCLAVTIKMPSVRSLSPVVSRLRQMFDLGADVTMIGAAMAHDSLLKKLLAARPGLRVPRAWDSFELAMRAVLGQQVSLQAGRQLTQTLVRLCGTQLAPAVSGDATLGWLFPTAAQVAAADLTPLRMPMARKRALLELAKAARQDPHLFDASANIEQTVSRLSAIAGVGEWTAHYIAMRAAGEADAFPATDVALLRCMEQQEGIRPSKAQFIERAQQWRPWRAYAAQHIWTAGAPCAAASQRPR